MSWAARRGVEYSRVDDPEFITLMRSGRPNIEMPTRQMLSRDVLKAFKGAREKMKQRFKVSVGRRRVGGEDTLTHIAGDRLGH